MRIDGRLPNQLRKVKIIPEFLINPQGSVLIQIGKTKVICSATVVDEVPSWMKSQKVKGGWITAEYELLPSSTSERSPRERKGLSGRTQEIQRLIGRSLRAACDLNKIDGKTIYIDCDVIDADGGTRCASITGAMVALNIAIKKLLGSGKIRENPVKNNIAAVSVGILDGALLLDLCYEEDKGAEVDMNIVMNENMELVEIQGTAEGIPFTKGQMNGMVRLAEKGLKKLFILQKKVMAEM